MPQIKGVISGTLQWLAHPIYDDHNEVFWLLGLALVLCVSFLWSTVVKSIVE